MVTSAGAGPHPIDAPGTGERVWASWPGLTELPEAELGGPRSAVIVAAHPDDEVLGAGGLIAMLAASGARLRLVAVTDGEGSHGRHADPAELAQRRIAETDAALKALGAESTEVVRLGFPDSGLAEHEDRLTAALAGLTEGFDICLTPWDGDLHTDHEAAGRAARRTCPGALRFPIWMWHWAVPGDPRVPWERAVRVPLPSGAATAKKTAIGCFASQLEVRAPGLGPVLPPDITAHFDRDWEILLR
jgi:LmbE family N-acetylglucosaminyl deacetylase